MFLLSHYYWRPVACSKLPYNHHIPLFAPDADWRLSGHIFPASILISAKRRGTGYSSRQMGNNPPNPLTSTRQTNWRIFLGSTKSLQKKRDMPRACGKSAAPPPSPRPALFRTRLSLNALLASCDSDTPMSAMPDLGQLGSHTENIGPTCQTIEFTTDVIKPPLRCCNPMAMRPRWVMPDVLLMAAL